MVDENCTDLNGSPSRGLEFILSSGWKLHYFETGPVGGFVILFVHGLSESSEYWMRTINSREMHKFRCLAIDLPGHGYSDKPKNFDYSMEAQAEVIQEFLNQKGIGHVVYIGHSLGGDVGMALLQLHPQSIQKIVLVDSPLTVLCLPDLVFRLRYMPEWLYNLVFPFMMLTSSNIGASIFFENPTKEMLDLGSRVARQAKSYSLIRSIKQTFIFLEKGDQLSSFKKLNIPHHFIYGATDLPVARKVNDYFNNESWVHVIPDVKHCPMVEAPGTFSEILDGILLR